jgi:hypothetical protein
MVAVANDLIIFDFNLNVINNDVFPLGSLNNVIIAFHDLLHGYPHALKMVNTP